MTAAVGSGARGVPCAAWRDRRKPRVRTGTGLTCVLTRRRSQGLRHASTRSTAADAYFRSCLAYSGRVPQV
jgi:hypothetical protein